MNSSSSSSASSYSCSSLESLSYYQRSTDPSSPNYEPELDSIDYHKPLNQTLVNLKVNEKTYDLNINKVNSNNRSEAQSFDEQCLTTRHQIKIIQEENDRLRNHLRHTDKTFGRLCFYCKCRLRYYVSEMDEPVFESACGQALCKLCYSVITADPYNFHNCPICGIDFEPHQYSISTKKRHFIENTESQHSDEIIWLD